MSIYEKEIDMCLITCKFPYILLNVSIAQSYDDDEAT